MNWLTGSKIGEIKRLIAQLADPAQRNDAGRLLIEYGADAVTPLLEALQAKDPNLLLIYQHVLARIPSASPPLITLLTTAHPVIRARAADTFAISRDRSAVPALLDALQGEYFTVRSRAALALGSIGDPKAVPTLLLALKDRETEVRIAACHALGVFREPSTFDEVAEVLLDDPIIDVRQAAARALGNTGHPKAIPLLMEALHDSYWWYERESAAGDLLEAIEKMGAEAVDPLIDALQDKEGTVRKFAAILLGRISDRRAIEPLGMAQYDMHHDVGNASAQALARFGAPAVGVLSDALSHPEMWIRLHAVRALGQIRDVQVTPLLLHMLDDPERDVKKVAIEALGGRKEAAAAMALEHIANNRADRDLASLAKSALGKG